MRSDQGDVILVSRQIDHTVRRHAPTRRSPCPRQRQPGIGVPVTASATNAPRLATVAGDGAGDAPDRDESTVTL